MQTFVVRFLGADQALIGWARHRVVPDQGVMQVPVSEFLIEAPGRLTYVSVQWTDLDVARLEEALVKQDVPAEAVGRLAQYHWTGPLWKVARQENVPLPSVTERGPVALAPPTGSLAGTV